MTKEDLKKLRKNLPQNFENTLSVKFGITPESILQILRGHRNNEAVILEACNMVEQHAAVKTEKLNFIKNL